MNSGNSQYKEQLQNNRHSRMFLSGIQIFRWKVYGLDSRFRGNDAFRKSLTGGLIFLMAFLFMGPNVQGEDIDTLQDRRIKKLEQKIRGLESKIKGSSHVKSDGHGKSKGHGKSDGHGKGAGHSSAPSLHMKGYIQFKYTAHEDDRKHGHDDEDTFAFKNIRLRFYGALDKKTDYRVEIDVSDKTDILKWAYVDLQHIPFAKIRAGQFKAPFGLEALKEPYELDVIATSEVSHLAPSFDKGFQMGTKFFEKKPFSFSYAVGVFNGTGRADHDDNDAKDYVGRLTMAPIKGLTLGGSGQIGDQGANLGRQRVGADLAFKKKGLKFEVEYVRQKEEHTPHHFEREEGWYVLAGYKFKFGMMPFIVFERFNPNIGTPNDEKQFTTVGVNHYLDHNHNTKLKLHYRIIKEKPTEIDNNELLAMLQVKFK